MKNQKEYYKQKINKELSIRKNDIAVLLAIPGINRIHKSMQKTYRNSLVTIINILLKIDNKIKVIAKVHPKDDLKNFLFLNDISKNIILTKKYEIPYLLNISSMFLVNISSSIIDAMFLGVPVITYNLKNLELVDRELYEKEYFLEKTAIQVFEKRELKKTKIRQGDILLLLTPRESHKEVVNWLGALTLQDRDLSFTQHGKAWVALSSFLFAVLLHSLLLV